MLEFENEKVSLSNPVAGDAGLMFPPLATKRRLPPNSTPNSVDCAKPGAVPRISNAIAIASFFMRGTIRDGMVMMATPRTIRAVSPVANALSFLGREALRIVLPSWCIACERELPWRARTASCCASCWSALPKIDGAKCTSCAMPLVGSGDALCIECILDPLPVDWCDAWGEYRGTLERLLHALKFERHDFLDDAFAALLDETLRDREFDVIVPVPMHRAKERKRGYNQAELLARALARRIDVPCDMLLS